MDISTITLSLWNFNPIYQLAVVAIATGQSRDKLYYGVKCKNTLPLSGKREAEGDSTKKEGVSSLQS